MMQVLVQYSAWKAHLGLALVQRHLMRGRDLHRYWRGHRQVHTKGRLAGDAHAACGQVLHPHHNV
jgi:hypothetical protein